MSLINQMLKDLESRRTPEHPAHTLLHGDAAESNRGRNRKFLLMLSLLAGLLALILAYLVWEHFNAPTMATQPKQGAMAAEKEAVTSPPAPAVKETATAAEPPVEVEVKNTAPATRPLVAPASPMELQPQLLAIEPQQLTGSWVKQRITLKGNNLKQDSRVVVAWDDKEKLLPPQRLHWRDSNTLDIELVTGTQAGKWSVTLLDSESGPLHFQVLAPALVAEAEQPRVPASDEKYEDSGTPAGIEKHIRPLRPEQLAEKAYQEGYQQLQRGSQEGAKQKWLEALRDDPRHMASREGLAALYISQGRNVEASEVLAKGLELHPGNARFALMYARIQIDNGQLPAAVGILERALDAESQNADFYAFLAALYQRQKTYDKSIAAYQRALRLQPKQGVWWMGIGISLEGEGKSKEAATAYNEAKQSGNLPPRLLQYVEGRLGALQ